MSALDMAYGLKMVIRSRVPMIVCLGFLAMCLSFSGTTASASSSSVASIRGSSDFFAPSQGEIPLLTHEAADDPGSSRAGRVLDRVVWDPQRRNEGINIYSAKRDGSEAQRIFKTSGGFTLALVLDRQGRRVAFATCCTNKLPQLVVVPVLGGKPQKPLAKHRNIFTVGGIGWSPNGRRLVFEGFVDREPYPVAWLWTVRPDGTGLRRLQQLGTGPQGYGSNDALAWTPRGIIYSDGKDLRIWRHGSSRPLVSHARQVRISGNGRRLIIDRRRGERRSVWVSRADGSHLRRILKDPTRADAPSFYSLVPDYDGENVLALREQTKDHLPVWNNVTWAIADSPGSARVLDVTDGSFTFAWN